MPFYSVPVHPNQTISRTNITKYPFHTFPFPVPSRFDFLQPIRGFFFFQSLSIFFVSAHEYQPHLNVYSYPSPLFLSLPTGLNVDHDLPKSSLLLASTETCVAGVHFFFLRHLSELSLSDRIPEHLFPPCQPMNFLSQYLYYTPMLMLRNATQYCT